MYRTNMNKHASKDKRLRKTIYILAVVIVGLFVFSLFQQRSEKIPKQDASMQTMRDSIKVDKVEHEDTRATFNVNTRSITLLNDGYSTEIPANYSNSDLFEYGVSYSGRFISSSTISDTNSNTLDVFVFDFEDKQFLTIDTKLESVLNDIHVKNSTTKVSHYWSPSENALFLLVKGLYDKGKLFRLHVDPSNDQLVYDQEYEFENAVELVPIGWIEDGQGFAVEVVEARESVGDTGALKVTRSSIGIINSK